MSYEPSRRALLTVAALLPLTACGADVRRPAQRRHRGQPADA
ncbi:hypothetical protein ACIBQ6_12160 [Nonomuraea sp. NPDC049655]